MTNKMYENMIVTSNRCLRIVNLLQIKKVIKSYMGDTDSIVFSVNLNMLHEAMAISVKNEHEVKFVGELHKMIQDKAFVDNPYLFVWFKGVAYDAY